MQCGTKSPPTAWLMSLLVRQFICFTASLSLRAGPSVCVRARCGAGRVRMDPCIQTPCRWTTRVAAVASHSKMWAPLSGSNKIPASCQCHRQPISPQLAHPWSSAAKISSGYALLLSPEHPVLRLPWTKKYRKKVGANSPWALSTCYHYMGEMILSGKQL